MEGHDVRLSSAARHIYGIHDEIGCTVRSGINVESKFCRVHVRRHSPSPQTDTPILMDLLTEKVLGSSCPVKTLPFRLLPTEDRPWIVLQGDQGIDLANLRIDQVVHAPVLHYAIGMFRWLCRWLLPREICNKRLAVGATAKKAKHAKKTQRHRGCGKSFSHDRSEEHTS